MKQPGIRFAGIAVQPEGSVQRQSAISIVSKMSANRHAAGQPPSKSFS